MEVEVLQYGGMKALDAKVYIFCKFFRIFI